jgi:2-polyprenyl-3-methyl-5-hydroxy-6-metoxy-1,4-benzoquinol methylase
MTRRTETIRPDYFESLYTTDPDPWRFATSDYERDKYAATLAALPDRRFGSALEVGCSIGVLTQLLARRCDTLLALDVAETALAQARARCPGVRFERRAVPDAWPPGCFDLIVFSEVLYYLDSAAIRTTAERAMSALLPGGSILMVHFLGGTDYPRTGDEAAAEFMAATGLSPALQVRKPLYRIDRLDGAPSAAAPG